MVSAASESPRTGAARLPIIERLVDRNRMRAWSRRTPIDKQPTLGLAIITCMDCRIDVYEAFGLESGDANVLRNAGGLVTDDTIRSLVLSQRLLGTREVMIVHHTDCGLHNLDEASFVRDLESEAGATLPFRMGAFVDLDADVRTSVRRVLDSPFVARKEHVRGFVYDVATGAVREVPVDA
jgi:carbonic anhydrase